MATIKVDIVSAEGEIHSGDAAMVFAPASMGEVGIAPRHAPMLTTLKPGEELKVEITTTDAQGEPVSTELSLGLIQQNLLQFFGDQQTAVDTFFGGGYRKTSVRAGTSCTFRYRPGTRPIWASR